MGERIIPIECLDVIKAYGYMMTLAGTSYTKVDAVDVATFEVESGSGNLLAGEPVKKFDFGASVTSAVVYFVPAYDYDGFYAAGTKVAATGAEVDPDGVSLYTATISGTAVAIAKL